MTTPNEHERIVEEIVEEFVQKFVEPTIPGTLGAIAMEHVRSWLVPKLTTIITKHQEEMEKVREEEREKRDNVFQSTNIKELIEKMGEDAEEYGQYHEDDCPLMREDGGDFGDMCECKIIKTLKHFAREHMGKVNELWVTHLAEHRNHCTPIGRKDLTLSSVLAQGKHLDGRSDR